MSIYTPFIEAAGATSPIGMKYRQMEIDPNNPLSLQDHYDLGYDCLADQIETTVENNKLQNRAQRQPRFSEEPDSQVEFEPYVVPERSFIRAKALALHILGSVGADEIVQAVKDDPRQMKVTLEKSVLGPEFHSVFLRDGKISRVDFVLWEPDNLDKKSHLGLIYFTVEDAKTISRTTLTNELELREMSISEKVLASNDLVKDCTKSFSVSAISNIFVHL